MHAGGPRNTRPRLSTERKRTASDPVGRCMIARKSFWRPWKEASPTDTTSLFLHFHARRLRVPGLRAGRRSALLLGKPWLTSGRRLAHRLRRWVGVGHASCDETPLKASYGQVPFFKPTTTATCRTLEWWADVLQLDVQGPYWCILFVCVPIVVARSGGVSPKQAAPSTFFCNSCGSPAWRVRRSGWFSGSMRRRRRDCQDGGSADHDWARWHLPGFVSLHNLNLNCCLRCCLRSVWVWGPDAVMLHRG